MHNITSEPADEIERLLEAPPLRTFACSALLYEFCYLLHLHFLYEQL
jgi:hypothetical protein